MIQTKQKVIHCFQPRGLQAGDEAAFERLAEGLPAALQRRLQASAGSVRRLGAGGADGTLQAAAVLQRLPAAGVTEPLLARGTVLWPLLFAPGYDQQRRFVRFCMAWQAGLPGPQTATVAPGPDAPDADEQTALYLSEGMVLRGLARVDGAPLLLFRRQYLPPATRPTKKIPLADLAALGTALQGGWAAASLQWGRRGVTLCLQPVQG